MKLRAYAKINLWLRVLGTRGDGYHEIETVFQNVSLHDELELETTNLPGPRVDVVMVPHVEDNLALRAAHSVAAGASLRIAIHKSIPLAAGLAGGSADAAAVLAGLNDLLRLELDEQELQDEAAALGSDVPLFLAGGGTVLGLGRGERVARLSGPPSPLWFVLGISEAGLATADVYRRWRPTDANGRTFEDLLVALGSPTALGAAIRNDLEAPALEARPELAEKLALVRAEGALRAFISGSGPTVVGLARDEGHARALARALAGRFDRVEVVRSHGRGIEPVGGAPLR